MLKYSPHSLKYNVGNGRPFALELTLAAHSVIEPSVLEEIRLQINEGINSELNKEKDVQILLLTKVGAYSKLVIIVVYLI